VTPADHLNSLVERLNATPEPDADLILDIGCGELENLIRDHEAELWPEIEDLARTDIRFRRAFGSAWAYDSPEYERRQWLLKELGEFSPASVHFILQREDFLPNSLVSWRAVRIEGEPAAGQLSRILREIADWYDREPLDENPEVSKERSVWPAYYAWSQKRWELNRASHRIAVAPDRPALLSAMDEAGDVRDREQERWAALVESVRLGRSS
jgi:hypothetical protein